MSSATINLLRSTRPISITRNDRSLSISHIPGVSSEVALQRVIWAHYDPTSYTLEVIYIPTRKKRSKFPFAKVDGQVNEAERSTATAWAEALMHDVYEAIGIKRSRRLCVLINPHGGTRKAVMVFNKKVEPIFKAARCTLTVTRTTHNGHAYDIAKSLTLDYDAVVTVSGDGLIHEVMNGFANHEKPGKALRIPISPIPTGSGNGLSLNLLGIEDGFDVVEAALNVIKGRPMKVDVFSVLQEGKRSLSFMSQALGLMADLDIGTENLRWMGDARFLVGLLRGIIQFKPCPVQLSYKLAEQDKIKMAQDLISRQSVDHGMTAFSEPPEGEEGTLPPLNTLDDNDSSWTSFEEPLLYVYAGKGPYVGRDMMAFPVSVPDDGLIDITAMALSSRKDVITQIGTAAKGENYWHQKLHYVKAHAYRVRPLTEKGCLSIDGEVFPFKEYQVEVHPKLATLMSMYGKYAVKFSGVDGSSSGTSEKVLA